MGFRKTAANAPGTAQAPDVRRHVPVIKLLMLAVLVSMLVRFAWHAEAP
jgi:hypothetical protein